MKRILKLVLKIFLILLALLGILTVALLVWFGVKVGGVVSSTVKADCASYVQDVDWIENQLLKAQNDGLADAKATLNDQLRIIKPSAYAALILILEEKRTKIEVSSMQPDQLAAVFDRFYAGCKAHPDVPLASIFPQDAKMDDDHVWAVAMERLDALTKDVQPVEMLWNKVLARGIIDRQKNKRSLIAMVSETAVVSGTVEPVVAPVKKDKK